MAKKLILASGSKTRAVLLKNAGLEIVVEPARINEDTVRDRMMGNGACPREIAVALAGEKAGKISVSFPDILVLGCDQIAAYQHQILTKPSNPDEALSQLAALSGKSHTLYSAATLYLNDVPVWHHVGEVVMQMHAISDTYLRSYVERNWESIRHSVGSYKLEEEGVRLFSAVRGDYFHVLGLPLIELLSYLAEQGELER